MTGLVRCIKWTAKEAVELRKEAEKVVDKKVDRLESMPVFIT